MPKSPSPDKNGLPAPLNLKMDYANLIPHDIADGGNLATFSLNNPISSSPQKNQGDNSDIHLYLKEKSQNGAASNVSVDSVENKCFSRTFAKENMEQRVARLEQFVFGKIANGTTTITTRLEKIAKIVDPQATVTSPDESSSQSAQNSDQILSGQSSAALKQTESLIAVINHGIDHYNVHDYQRAEDDFEQCCAMAPDMARVHSYLAITKLQENERPAALEEFRTTYAIDPFGTYGRYAKLCLLKLAGDEEIRKRGPVDSDEVLQSSLDKINKQSAGLINFHNRESSRTPQLPFGTGFAAQIQATSAKNNTVLQNAFTQESANNLKHLMGLKAKPGDAHLRAWGTNLNTRYYGSDTYLYAPYYIPREYPVELKAQQQTLSAPLPPHLKLTKRHSNFQKKGSSHG
ncbi:MAG: hypothetical protein P4L53_00460 [Candidatus Obscuribacterales bacterium]|nr:hypothetical protein [Candidatus Obscuribacterales bacterium]